MHDPVAVASDRPSRVRYQVIGLTTLMSVILYLDRLCLPIAQDLIREDLGITSGQVQWILSSFFLSYALGQVPSGWFSDRFGARAMLALYILLWSLATAAMGLATGFLSLLALRLGQGLAQAGAYPTAGIVLSRWAPITMRGLASVIVAFGGRVGGSAAPILTAYLIVLLVPATKPSTLTSSDLLDLPGFCRAVVAGENNPESAAAAIMKRFSKETGELVRRLAATSESAPQVDISVPDKQDVATGLNEILKEDQFCQEAFVSTLALSDQALGILRKSPDARSRLETERVNRLVLEATFPKHIRKVYVAGWRPMLMIYGAAGLLVAAMFWFMFRNRPEEHRSCNLAESELIRAGWPPTGATTQSAVPIMFMLRSRSLWLCSISQIGTNVGWVFLVSMLPRYLQEVHRVPIEQRGLMASIPLFVGWFGMLLGGTLTDRMTRLLGLRLGRALPMGLSRFLGMGAYLACLLPLSDWFGPYWTPWVLTAAFSVVAFSTDLGVGAVWAFCQDVGGRNTGSIMGWGNMWGNFGAFATPPFLDWVLGKPAVRWDLAFMVCAAGFLVAGISALAVDATKPIVPEEPAEA